jgi:hypothetical protein
MLYSRNEGLRYRYLLAFRTAYYINFSLDVSVLPKILRRSISGMLLLHGWESGMQRFPCHNQKLMGRRPLSAPYGR